MRTITTVEYCRVSPEGKKSDSRKRKYFKTKSLSAAMRRFFAERGDETDLLPTRVWQNTYN